jgi:hypothetical protein
MQTCRLEWVALFMFACGCASGGSANPSPGAPPSPSVVNPEPASDPGNVTAPTSEVPAQKPPLAHVDLECELTKSDGACNQAEAKSMSVTIHSVNTCNISGSTQELSLTVESSNEGPKDSIRVLVPGYPNATGHYPITAPNLVALSDAGGPTAMNGAAPHGAGSECSNACTVDVQERPGRVRQLVLDVSCNELCVPNECLRCRPSGGGPVTFKLAVGCP